MHSQPPKSRPRFYRDFADAQLIRETLATSRIGKCLLIFRIRHKCAIEPPEPKDNRR